MTAALAPAMQQLPLAIGSPPQPSFSNFQCAANEPARAHLLALERPAPPVYLWGPASSGKSHLLRALAAHARDGDSRAGWFEPGASAPWELGPGWSLVLVDRCDELAPHEQHAAFALFEHARAAQVTFVAAGRFPPVDLPLREDLRTRLGWGHVFAMQPPDEDETRAVLRREADRRGIWLSDDVMAYLMSRFPRDLASLMALLDRLDRFALARSRAVTVPLVRQMVAQDDGPAGTTDGSRIAPHPPRAAVPPGEGPKR